jgi:hypothetical protein
MSPKAASHNLHQLKTVQYAQNYSRVDLDFPQIRLLLEEQTAHPFCPSPSFKLRNIFDGFSFHRMASEEKGATDQPRSE